jgi:hypothetical protein
VNRKRVIKRNKGVVKKWNFKKHVLHQLIHGGIPGTHQLINVTSASHRDEACDEGYRTNSSSSSSSDGSSPQSQTASESPPPGANFVNLRFVRNSSDKFLCQSLSDKFLMSKFYDIFLMSKFSDIFDLPSSTDSHMHISTDFFLQTCMFFYRPT